MIPKLLYFLVPAALLLVSVLAIFLWDRTARPVARPESGDGAPEGAFRVFYHVLWVLILWSGLSLSLPFWVSYREKVAAAASVAERWSLIAMVMVFPAILLGLLWYGGRQGYLKWIDGPGWPDEENK